jgi:hypothetical protein
MIQLLLLLLLLPLAALADDDFIIYSPTVNQGQSEIEVRGFTTTDKRASLNRNGAYELAIAHSFTDFWKTELYLGEFNHDPTTGTTLTGYEWENTFQFTEPGQYWLDSGLMMSLVHNNHAPDSLEFGPLLEKRWGHFIHRMNVLWNKELGKNASQNWQFRAGYSLGYKISSELIPGIEMYERPSDHARQAGPAISGEWILGAGNEIEYSSALLIGINNGAPDKTWVLRVAYEFF